MIGPYYYYDTSFVEDAQPELQTIHDCMWSGECFACQPARVAFSNPTATAPAAAVTESNGTTRLELERPTPSAAATALPMPSELDRTCNFLNVQPASFTKSEPEGQPTDSEHSSPDRPSRSSRTIGVTRRSASTCKRIRPACSQQESNSTFNSTLSSSYASDNKKLRHREVEKNRHRQLQAMVKTLSGKIPGRLEKETQVQTMKRAARYCIYLRDVMNVLQHSLKATKPNLLKQKLEEIYLRSCENVELVMSQHTSAR